MFRPLQKMGSREASGLHPNARIKSKSERSFVLPEKAAQPVGLGGAQVSALTKQPRQRERHKRALKKLRHVWLCSTLSSGSSFTRGAPCDRGSKDWSRP